MYLYFITSLIITAELRWFGIIQKFMHPSCTHIIFRVFPSLHKGHSQEVNICHCKHCLPVVESVQVESRCTPLEHIHYRHLTLQVESSCSHWLLACYCHVVQNDSNGDHVVSNCEDIVVVVAVVVAARDIWCPDPGSTCSDRGSTWVKILIPVQPLIPEWPYLCGSYFLAYDWRECDFWRERSPALLTTHPNWAYFVFFARF